jgi:hypothetical protein
VKARAGFACDDTGCVAKLFGGGLVAIGTSPAALSDDCARAVLVVAGVPGVRRDGDGSEGVTAGWGARAAPGRQ